MQEKGENTPFLISWLPDRSHVAGHGIRLNDDNRHHRPIAPVEPTSVPAPESKNGARLPIWRVAGSGRQPESTDLKFGSFAACDLEPSAGSPAKLARM
jgi:hypothetical protein